MKKAIRKALSLGLILVMVLGCFTVVSWGASKTKSMTAYKQCIKSGNTVYCNTGSGIYKVNIKSSSKRGKALVKLKEPAYESIVGMKLKNGYIYYSYSSMEDTQALYRIKTSGKSKKRLAEFINWSEYPQFVVSGKKIYYRGSKNTDSEKIRNWKMKLNGKSKKKVSIKAKTKYVATNNKGYRVVSVEKGDSDIYKYYLKKPSGAKVYLCTVNYDGE